MIAGAYADCFLSRIRWIYFFASYGSYHPRSVFLLETEDLDAHDVDKAFEDAEYHDGD